MASWPNRSMTSSKTQLCVFSLDVISAPCRTPPWLVQTPRRHPPSPQVQIKSTYVEPISKNTQQLLLVGIFSFSLLSFLFQLLFSIAKHGATYCRSKWGWPRWVCSISDSDAKEPSPSRADRWIFPPARLLVASTMSVTVEVYFSDELLLITKGNNSISVYKIL